MERYKIMIVDDEAEVREGIVAHMDWDALGFEVVAEAENGQDGLDKAENLDIDVLLTDIKMPYLDGLAMSAELMRTHPSLKLILFSGFDEFEYAKEAIRLNVVEYVLKPVNVEELTGILRRVKDSLDAEIAERRNIEALTSAYNKSLPLMRERFLSELLWGSIRPEEIAQQLALHDLHINKAKNKIVTVFDLTLSAEQNLPFAREFIPFSVKRAIEEQLEGKCDYATTVGSSTVIVITAWDAENCITRLMQAVNETCAYCQRIFGLVLSAGISRSVPALEDIHSAYMEAKAALEYRPIAGTGKAIYIQDMEQFAQAQETETHSSDRHILSVIKFGSSEQIRRMVETLLLPLRSEEMGLWGKTAYLTDTFFNAILQIVNRYELYNEEKISLRLEKLCTLLPCACGEEEMRDFLCDTLVCLSEFIAEQRESASKRLVEQAKAFIAEQYANPHLSVDRLCEHLHVSASYFSTVFKQETGQSYVQYLTETRMQQALRLLSETDDKTYIIASKVGYEEPNYFSYVFKKRFGASPSTYRGQ